MEKSVTTLADELLEGGSGRLKDLHIHEFPDDQSAHDDAAIERLYSEFASELDSFASELSKKFGPPIHTGMADEGDIPLNGVFRFAMWEIDGIRLFIAAAHEDRGVPILLMMGRPKTSRIL